MLVMTVDQKGSRKHGDRVDPLLDLLHGAPVIHRLVRPFERTAGDEIQGLLDDPEMVVELALTLLRAGDWHVGIGVGQVQRPIPRSVRSASGPAFVYARAAVDRAKRNPQSIAVLGPEPRSAGEAEGLLRLLGAVVRRRTPAGREVADLKDKGLAQKEIAAKLGITPQAVSQRLRSGLWWEEHHNRPLAARLLARADEPERAA